MGSLTGLPVDAGQSRYTKITSAGSDVFAVSGYRVVRMAKPTGATVVIAGRPRTTPGYAKWHRGRCLLRHPAPTAPALRQRPH